MTNRGMAAAYCPSDGRVGAGRADGDGTTEAEGKQQLRNLARAVDFYASALAMATHDLRQPLQVIVSAQELLARRITGQPEREHLERGAQASAQLEERLEQLVETLQLYQHFGRLELEPVRLDAILMSLAQQLDGPAHRKGVALRLLPGKAVIMSHPVLLNGILRNLARNALDHTSRGGRVLVGCRRCGPKVRTEVHDTGGGIPPDKLQSIFEPFFRLDTARSDGPGLGLGLFIVKRAADCLGHRIELRSALGRGSCFSLVADAATV